MMPSYVVVLAKIKNAEKLAEYSKAAGPIVAKYEGKFVTRAPIVESLTQNSDFERFVLIEFPNPDIPRVWYNSPEYQALIPLREEGAEMIFSLAVVPD
jgi:uncharacterized protein (DUF1330 family)